MKKIYRPLLIILFSCIFLEKNYAQEEKYAVKNIPENLLKDANSVVREEFLQFTVKDVGNAVTNHHIAITILNSKGDKYYGYAANQDEFHSLQNISISIYDSNGVKIKTYQAKDLSMENYGDEELVPDGKYYYLKASPPAYPITIEINETLKQKGTLFYPEDEIQEKNQSVQNSSLQISVPQTIGLRYKVINLKDSCIKSSDVSNTTYTWVVKNLPAKKIEHNSGPLYQYLPEILLAPKQFKMDDYAGDMSTWQGLGKWYNALVSTTNTFPPEEQAFYQNLVKDKTTDREKAETIYRYMQNHIRYVAIELGIGGWKPFPASFVDAKKYGDCKALVNYMQAALNAVGIKSYPVINYAGTLRTPLVKEFPINAFNHVLLCIPQANDSIWLECTSSSCDFGELNPETQNHPALLVNENGGELITIPPAKTSDNIISSKSIINLNKDGSASVETHYVTTGEAKQESVYYLYQESEDNRKNFLYNELKLKPADSLAFSENNKFDTPFIFDTKMRYGNFPDFTTGAKTFMPSRLLNLFREDIDDDTARKQDYYFDYPYKISDTVELRYPQGFQPEDLPQDKNFETPYTSYSSKYLLDTAAHIIQVITQISVTKQTVKAQDYQKLSDFADKVADDLDEKIVLDNNE